MEGWPASGMRVAHSPDGSAGTIFIRGDLMKSVSQITRVLMFGLTLVACAPKNPANPRPTAKATSLEEELSGIWKLKTADAASADGVKAPRLILLAKVQNGMSIAKFCGLDGQFNGSVSPFIEKGDTLALHFVIQETVKGDDGKEVPKINERNFVAKLTKHDANAFELDGKIVYELQSPLPSLSKFEPDDENDSFCKQ